VVLYTAKNATDGDRSVPSLAHPQDWPATAALGLMPSVTLGFA